MAIPFDPIELGEEINNRKVTFKLHSGLWEQLSSSDSAILSIESWSKAKFLDNDGTAYHPDVESIPDDKGGLYAFVAVCPILDGVTSYLFYIGRAQLTTGQNLKKRCKEYKSPSRPKLMRMNRYWGKYLHIYYLPLDSNEEIVRLEEELINCLTPPMNPKIPRTSISNAVSAFQ